MEKTDSNRMAGPFLPMIKELPEGERPREKMLAQGAGSLSTAELLAVLIASGSAGNSAIGLANRVMALEPGGLASLASYQPEEFMKIPGIGTAKACILSAALELGKRAASAPSAERLRVDSSRDAAELFMGEMRHLKKEVLQTALLNVKKELLMRESIAVGGLSSAVIQPREVFANAIRKGAFGIILAHNHPSGDPTPSEEDVAMTKQLAEAGRILGIAVVDHIIIGDGVYVSLQEQNLL